jgi:hypothetical protein
MGQIHAFASPLPNQIDDYIAVPKINGYQALHTTIVTSMGSPVDVIIQTQSMADQAKLGSAIMYKQSHHHQRIELPDWIDTLISLEQDEQDLQAFFSMLQTEIFGERRRAFIGEKKQLIDLPGHATLLDVAYYINPETGGRADSADVNKSNVNLKHFLQDGDHVIFRTESSFVRTSEDLRYLQTSLARKLLMRQLMEQPKSWRRAAGKRLLESTIDIAVDPFFSIQWQKHVREVAGNDDNVLADIGAGTVDPFLYLEEQCRPEDFFLLDPICFQFSSRLPPHTEMRYALRTTVEDLRRGHIVGIQSAPDVVDVVSSTILLRERRFSREFLPLRINQNAVAHPLYFGLRCTFEPDANPLAGISSLQSLLETPVKLLRFEPTSVTLGFHTDHLRTLQIAYEYLFELPYITSILRITPA